MPTAKKNSKKKTKKIPSKYKEKLVVKGTFEQLIAVLVKSKK